MKDIKININSDNNIEGSFSLDENLIPKIGSQKATLNDIEIKGELNLSTVKIKDMSLNLAVPNDVEYLHKYYNLIEDAKSFSIPVGEE